MSQKGTDMRSCTLRRLSFVSVVAAASLVFAACAMPADDPNYVAEVNGGGAAAESANAAAMSEGQAAVDAAMAAPTSIGVDAPLSKAPQKGAVIVSLSDGSPLDTLIGTSMAEAAKVLGWEYKEATVAASTDGTSQAPAAFDEALALKPAAIRISGSYADSLTEGLAKAASAGVAVVCTGCGSAPDGALKDTSLDGADQNTQWGNLLSAYMLLERSPGEDAGAELFTTPGGGAAAFNTAFASQVATLCRNCSTNEDAIDPMTVTDIASFVNDTMSTALGRWAVLDTGINAQGVADAVAANPALLSPVIVTGRFAGAKDLAALSAASGTAAGDTAGGTSGGTSGGTADAGASAAPASAAPAATDAAAAGASGAADAGSADLGTPEQAAARQAWIAVSVPILGWRVVDQMARILGGDALATGPVPSQLLTPANVKDAVVDANGEYVGIQDYAGQFTKLWAVG